MIVTAGVAIASYGELKLVMLGVILQLAAVATESTRLILVQILLQVCASTVLWHAIALSSDRAANSRSTCALRGAQHIAQLQVLQQQAELPPAICTMPSE